MTIILQYNMQYSYMGSDLTADQENYSLDIRMICPDLPDPF